MPDSDGSFDPVEPQVVRDPDDRERLLAALSYVGLLFLLPIVAGEKSDFVRFHARQGAVMCAFEFAAMLIGAVPLIGWSFFIAVFVVAAIALYRAHQGRRWEIPYVGKWAREIKL
jgi:uncharacterized membrane protein